MPMVLFNVLVVTILLYVKMEYPAYFPKVPNNGFVIIGTLISFLLVSLL